MVTSNIFVYQNIATYHNIFLSHLLQKFIPERYKNFTITRNLLFDISCKKWSENNTNVFKNLSKKYLLTSLFNNFIFNFQ